MTLLTIPFQISLGKAKEHVSVQIDPVIVFKVRIPLCGYLKHCHKRQSCIVTPLPNPPSYTSIVRKRGEMTGLPPNV